MKDEVSVAAVCAVVVGRDRELTYWDPMPHLASVFVSQPQDGLWPSPEETFFGKWDERNWRNVPGPFYGALTDNCWVGRLHAPRHVLYGDDSDYESEFLYRQPRNSQELRDVIAGCTYPRTDPAPTPGYNYGQRCSPRSRPDTSTRSRRNTHHRPTSANRAGWTPAASRITTPRTARSIKSARENAQPPGPRIEA
jgi:hypothetical protein